MVKGRIFFRTVVDIWDSLSMVLDKASEYSLWLLETDTKANGKQIAEREWENNITKIYVRHIKEDF